MSIFTFLFDGGNIGLIAKSLGKHYKTFPNFNSVLTFYLSDFLMQKRSIDRMLKVDNAIDYINNGYIKNYVDLAVLVLMVDAAPISHNIDIVYENFAKKLEIKLIKNHIDEDSVKGNVFVDWDKFDVLGSD
jgi:hypothetical protein